MRLSISKLVLVLSAGTILVCGNAFSTTADSDRVASSDLTSVKAVPIDNSVSLRGLKTVSTTVDEERAALNKVFAPLKNLIPGYKAAKAAKAAEIAKQNKKYTLLLDRDDHLYTAMAGWYKNGETAVSIYQHMKAVGITHHDASTIFLRYSVYLQEKMSIPNVGVRKPQ